MSTWLGSTEGSSQLHEEATSCLWDVFSHNRDKALVSPHPLFSLRTVLSIHMTSSAWNYNLFKTHLNTTVLEARPSLELEVWRYQQHMLFVFMRKAREMDVGNKRTQPVRLCQSCGTETKASHGSRMLVSWSYVLEGSLVASFVPLFLLQHKHPLPFPLTVTSSCSGTVTPNSCSMKSW